MGWPVRRLRPRQGNPWLGIVHRRHRPTHDRTLRVLRRAADDRYRSPLTVARMTGRRALSSAVARRLAAVATSGSWTRAAIAQRFEEIGTPDADRIATRLFDLLPTPPVEGVDSVYRLLSELPHIDEPAPVVEQPDHEWRFDVPKWTHTVAVAQAVGLTPAELDWFADPGEWLRNKAPTLQHYRYRIRSDHRLLEAPKERLREVQRRILRGLLDRVLRMPPRTASCAGAAFTRSRHRMRVEMWWCGSICVRSFRRFPRLGCGRFSTRSDIRHGCRV